MIDLTLHATPRWRDVVLEQVHIVRLSLGAAALIVAAALASGTVMVVGEIMAGGRGFDSNETFPTALIAFLYPFAVWRSDKRFGAAFLWTLPVERRQLALARVFAGFVWLMAGLTFFLSWLLSLGLLAGVPPELTLARVPIVSTIATYLFGSAVVLGLRHPLRWLLGVAGLIVLMGALGGGLSQPDGAVWHSVPGVAALSAAIERTIASWLTLPDPVESAVINLIWIGAGFAAVWVAASRHRERHRHRKRQR